MSAAVEERLYTPEDLLNLPDMNGFELVDGQLVEKGMGSESAWIANRLAARITLFVEELGLGWATGSEGSYQCFPAFPRRVRKPDASFVRLDRLPNGFPPGHTSVAPDLAVEVVSPNDRFSEVRGKVEEYLAAGVPLVWVIDPESRTADVHRPGLSAQRLREDDVLDGEDVLPGFRCRLGDVLPAKQGTEEPV